MLSELNVKQFSITFCSTYFSSTSTGISIFGAFYFYFGGFLHIEQLILDISSTKLLKMVEQESH
jgi:hypothetical protein